MRVTRRQVLEHRVAVQGLAREGRRPADLAVLDIGVQEAMGQPAGLAFAARLPADVPLPEFGPDRELALAWTFRGAPNVHRRADLPRVAKALWPLSEADAASRLNETGPSVARAGIDALDQFSTAVEAMRAVVTAPTAKGAASSAATARIPAAMRRDCRPCRAQHISDSAMRTAALAAGLELDPSVSPPLLLRIPKATTVRCADLTALRDLAARYLALLGPATDADVADYLGVRRADLQAAWPQDLAPVSVDGRDAWLAESDVEALGAAPVADLVRLLGPFDPFMQARDRNVLVPDRSVHKQLWPVLGRPGVLLVDAEVVGCWRAKAAKSSLTLTIDAWAPLPKRVWSAVEDEAQRVAEVRGKAEARVVRAA